MRFFCKSLYYQMNFDVLPLANQITQSLTYKCAHQLFKEDLIFLGNYKNLFPKQSKQCQRTSVAEQY